MPRIAGYGGGVFTDSLLVEDCEDAWDEQVVSGVTQTADGTVFKVGTKSAKFAVGDAVSGNTIIGSEAISPSKNLSTYKSLYAWVRSSVALALNDYQILLDDSPNCGSPLKSLNLPNLLVDTWKRVNLNLGDASGLTGIQSIGIKQIVDKGAMNFWIDDVRAPKLIAGVKSWTIDQVFDVHEGTGFDSGGNKQYIPGACGWSGSFEGFKDGAPLTIGTEVILALGESTAITQQFVGSVIITGLHAGVGVDGLVTYSYDFQGTEALEIPTA